MSALATTIGMQEMKAGSKRVSPSLLGEVLDGRFVVRRVIGRGGCSTVYQGWHLDLECPVAIKVMTRSVLLNESLRRYFRSEAVITAGLSNPHMVHVYARGVLPGGVPYTVMEYLRGQSLSTLLDTVGQLPVAVAVDLALQVCSALEEAHSRSITHCDIKPENLFLTELADGSTLLKVIDFGTARGSHTPKCIWSSCVGTPGYMSPEQIRTPARIDHRADVWALGVVLFQMVSGRLPFEHSTTKQQMEATLSDEPARLPVFVPDLSSEFCDVVVRCLAKDPSRRFQSVAQLADALRSVRPNAPTSQVHQATVLSSAAVRLVPPGAASEPSACRKRLSFEGRRLAMLCTVIAGLGAAVGTQFPVRTWTNASRQNAVMLQGALAGVSPREGVARSVGIEPGWMHPNQ